MNLRKRLLKSVSKSLPQYNVKVFQSKNWLSSLFKFKDFIPSYLRSHLVYQFQCSNCNITYYGETEHYLKYSASENVTTAALIEKRVNNNKKSSVKDHCLLSCHCLLPSWIMNHTSLNIWLKNLHLLPRINHYWINKLNHWN